MFVVLNFDFLMLGHEIFFDVYLFVHEWLFAQVYQMICNCTREAYILMKDICR